MPSLKNYSLFPWVTGLLMAGILVVPGSYALLTYWLAVYGIWHVNGLFSRVLVPSWYMGAVPIWIGMAIYVVTGVGLGLWQGDKAAYFEAYVPMLLAPFIVNAIAVARPPLLMLWVAAASAAVLAGLMACYQSLHLNMGRAIGVLNNQIMFGDLSVVLAMFCAFGWLFGCQGKYKMGLKIYLFLGMLMGLLASLLSGTKGGWMSIFMVALVLISVSFAGWQRGKRLGVGLVFLTAVFVLAWLVPPELVIDRISDGGRAAYIWFASGQITDGSVSIRLEMWRQALSMIADSPWTGWGTSDARVELASRLASIGAGDGWIQVENDLLQAGIVHGIPAMLSYLIFYAGLIWGFSRIRQHAHGDMHIFALSLLGMLLTVVMVEFGLSVVVLGRNAFRHTWVVWSMLLLGYLISNPPIFFRKTSY